MAADISDILDLPDLLSKLTDFSGKVSDAVTGVAKQQGVVNDASVAGAAAADAQVNTARDVVMSKGLHDLKQSQVMKDRLSMLGASDDPVTSEFIRLNNRIAAESEDIAQAHKAYQAKLSEDHFLDPIGYIINQIQIPGEAVALNAKIAGREADMRRANELLANATTASALWHSTDAATDMSMLHAVADQKAQEATVQASIFKMQAAQHNIQTFTALTALNEADLKASYQAFQAKATAQQMIFAANADTRAAVSSGLEVKMKNLQIAALQENKDAQDELIKRINAARTTLGQPPTSWKAFSIEPTAVKEKWQQIASSFATAGGMIGENPVNSVDVLRSVGAQLPSGAPQLIVKAVQKAEHDAMGANPAWKSLSKDQQRGEVLTRFGQQFKNEEGNIPEEGGILTPAPLSTWAKIPALAKGPIMSSLAPIATPNMKLTPELIMSQGEQLIAAGKIDKYQAATEISTIFRTAAQETSNTKWFDRFGIPLQKTFKAPLEMNPNGAWSNKSIIDNANPNAVLNALTRREAVRAFNSGGSGIFMGVK